MVLKEVNMKEPKRIILVMENCEGIELDKEEIVCLTIKGIKENAVFVHGQWLSEQTCERLVLSTKQKIERVMIFKDVVSIVLEYEDDEVVINVPWEGDEFTNTLQSNAKEGNVYKIVIER